MKDYDIEYLLDTHNEFWDKQRSELERYKNVYECRFWEDSPYSQMYGGNNTQIVTGKQILDIIIFHYL